MSAIDLTPRSYRKGERPLITVRSTRSDGEPWIGRLTRINGRTVYFTARYIIGPLAAPVSDIISIDEEDIA